MVGLYSGRMGRENAKRGNCPTRLRHEVAHFIGRAGIALIHMPPLSQIAGRPV